ncbi:hypothetical protein [Ktedonospora formicarum]|nr:hypothetical protein [Ktedonospora formicarum]
MVSSAQYPPNSGSLAQASEQEKRKRLDAMVRLWQSETQRQYERGDHAAFVSAMGLDEYRYSVWLRFPEWERSAVVAQVMALREVRSDEQESQPALFSAWKHEPLLKSMPDWKLHLPQETVFNISVRITPGGLGEGSKWAIVMPREMRARYRPGWPTQQEWVDWTRSFDWLAVSVGFIHMLLDTLEQ